MAQTRRHTREFKKRQCEYCTLADKRELRMGRPLYCGYKKDTGKDPDIRNGHCVPRIVDKKRRGESGDNTDNDEA